MPTFTVACQHPSCENLPSGAPWRLFTSPSPSSQPPEGWSTQYESTHDGGSQHWETPADRHTLDSRQTIAPPDPPGNLSGELSQQQMGQGDFWGGWLEKKHCTFPTNFHQQQHLLSLHHLACEAARSIRIGPPGAGESGRQGLREARQLAAPRLPHSNSKSGKQQQLQQHLLHGPPFPHSMWWCRGWKNHQLRPPNPSHSNRFWLSGDTSRVQSLVRSCASWALWCIYLFRTEEIYQTERQGLNWTENNADMLSFQKLLVNSRAFSVQGPRTF